MSAVTLQDLTDVPSAPGRGGPVPRLRADADQRLRADAAEPESAAGQPESPDAPGVLSRYENLLTLLASGTAVDPDRAWLVDEAAQVWSRPGFDTFLCLPHLRFEPFGYQQKAAQAALRRMRGRAILADEVGLGKTIEAGLVLSELRVRSLADRSL